MYCVDSQLPPFMERSPAMGRRPRPVPRAPTHHDAVSDRLRITRKATRLSQAAFARRAGISTSGWNNYERGRNRISVDEALKLCASFGVTLDWIYRGIDAGLPHQLAVAIHKVEADERQMLSA